MAFGFYKSSPRTRYAEVVVYNVPHITAAWGVRVVFLSEIPQHDWEWGAQGEGDFWNVVEQEVERLLEQDAIATQVKYGTYSLFRTAMLAEVTPPLQRY